MVASLLRKNLVSYTSCPYGNWEQDLNHVIWQCPKYESGRNDTIINVSKARNYSPCSMDSFLDKSYIVPLSIVHKFLIKYSLDLRTSILFTLSSS